MSEQAGKDTQPDPMIDAVINPSLSIDRAFADQIHRPWSKEWIVEHTQGRGRRRRLVLPSPANPSSIRNKTFPNRHWAAALWIDERMATLLTLDWLLSCNCFSFPDTFDFFPRFYHFLFATQGAPFSNLGTTRYNPDEHQQVA